MRLRTTKALEPCATHLLRHLLVPLELKGWRRNNRNPGQNRTNSLLPFDLRGGAEVAQPQDDGCCAPVVIERPAFVVANSTDIPRVRNGGAIRRRSLAEPQMPCVEVAAEQSIC